MRRVLVIGCPGSGKSTLARALCAAVGLPLYHLDKLYWNVDGTHVSREVFRARLTHVLRQPSWIIDGNYGSTLAWRLRFCDTVLFLDYPLEVCLGGIREREGQPRSDMPCLMPEGESEEFLAVVKEFNFANRPAIMDLLRTYPDKNTVIFQSRSEAAAFLANL